MSQGNGLMPAFSKLPDADLDFLLAYLFKQSGAPAETEDMATKKPKADANARYRSGFWLHVYE